MDYQVKLVKGTDGSIALDTVYAVDYSNKCRQMHDADGDSIPDECAQKTSTMCGEETGFEKVDCVDKHKTLFKLAQDHFKKYHQGSTSLPYGLIPGAIINAEIKNELSLV